LDKGKNTKGRTTEGGEGGKVLGRKSWLNQPKYFSRRTAEESVHDIRGEEWNIHEREFEKEGSNRGTLSYNIKSNRGSLNKKGGPGETGYKKESPGKRGRDGGDSSGKGITNTGGLKLGSQGGTRKKKKSKKKEH